MVVRRMNEGAGDWVRSEFCSVGFAADSHILLQADGNRI